MSAIGKWALWGGPALGSVVASASMTAGYGSDIAIVGFVAILCVTWWIFEPVPIPVTSLLPLAILPLLGVLSPSEVGEAYGSPLILAVAGWLFAVQGDGALWRAPAHSAGHGDTVWRQQWSSTRNGFYGSGGRAEYVDIQHGHSANAFTRGVGSA